MSEKTEQPTSKKVRDARKKGQVAKSTEVTSGVQLASLLAYFTIEGESLWQSLEAMVDVSIDVVNLDLIAATDQLIGVFGGIVIRFVVGIAAVVTVMTAAAVIAQTGPLLASEAVRLSLNKLNPVGNLKQMFSWRSVFEFAKSISKVVVLSLIFFYLVREYTPTIRFLPLCDAACGFAVATGLLHWMWATLVGFYVVIGIADIAFQRYNTTKQLMMSLQDVKQERKNTDGDPDIKQKRKDLHRDVQSGSLAENVSKSTAVVRNPTHVAVCLYYQPGETPLPQVIETGYGKVALRIVELAERAGIPVVENIPVARALAANTPVGRYVPAELFEPVAHILRIAMKLSYDDDEN